MYSQQPSILDNMRKLAKENIYSEEPTKKSHENPLYDIMVDISEQASKVDPQGNQIQGPQIAKPVNLNKTEQIVQSHRLRKLNYSINVREHTDSFFIIAAVHC